MFSRFRFVLMVALLALTACRGDGWTPEAVCAEVSARICAGLEDCDCRFDIRPYDAASCVTERAAACEAGLEAAVGPYLPRRVRLDGDAIASCLADLDAQVADCALGRDDAPLPATCDAFVRDRARIGADCATALITPCHDGDGLCVPSGNAMTCVARGEAGASCASAPCAEGLVCDTDSDAPVCAAPGGVGAPCGSDRACAVGLVCPPSGACAAPAADGEVCDDTADCATTLICDDGLCAPGASLADPCDGPDVCGVGSACGRAPENRVCADPDAQGAPCEEGTCAPGLACGIDSAVCEALPGEGAACLDGARCGAGLTCRFDTTTCVTPPGQGEPCLGIADRRCADGLGCREADDTCEDAATATAGEPCLITGGDYLCADGLGCDFAADGSFCIAPGGAGDPCTNDRVCGAGTYCEYSTLACTERRADGAPCEDGNECAAGSSCALLPDGWTCAPIPGADAPCLDVCADGLVCKGPGGACTEPLCVIP